MHMTECRFYELCETNNVPFKVPKCYYMAPMKSGRGGLLILEDLSITGTVPLLENGLDMEQVNQVAENLAHLHSWSLENQLFLAQEPFSFPASKKQMEQFVAIMHSSYKQMKSIWPEYFDPSIDGVIDACTTDNFYYLLAVPGHKALRMSPILVHGDVWTNNLLFEKKLLADRTETAGNKLIAFIDWQVCKNNHERLGNLAQSAHGH